MTETIDNVQVVQAERKPWQFQPGNQLGRGSSPFGQQMQGFHRELMLAVTPEALREVLDKLIACAKKGEPWAVREFLNRALGKVTKEFDVKVSVGPSIDLSKLDAAEIAALGKLALKAQGALPDANG